MNLKRAIFLSAALLFGVQTNAATKPQKEKPVEPAAAAPTPAPAIGTVVVPTEKIKALGKVLEMTRVMKVREYFQGPGNLIGVAVDFTVTNSDENAPKGLLFFTDPDARYMITGAILDMQSRSNVLGELAMKYFPNDKTGFSTEMLADMLKVPAGIVEKSAMAKGKSSRTLAEEEVTPAVLAKLPYIHDGPVDAKKVVYGLIDMHCVHCRRAFAESEDIRKALGPNGAIRWVPMSIGGNVSTMAAAYIVGSENPATALREYLGDDRALEKLRAGLDRPDVKKALAKGSIRGEIVLRLVSNLQIVSTPTFLVHNAKGKLRGVSGYGGPQAIARMFK